MIVVINWLINKISSKLMQNITKIKTIKKTKHRTLCEILSLKEREQIKIVKRSN